MSPSEKRKTELRVASLVRSKERKACRRPSPDGKSSKGKGKGKKWARIKRDGQ